jgi:predicted MFS family arabinose efflux permease
MKSDRSRWLVLALLFACRTGLGFQFQTLGSVSDQLIVDLGFNYTQVGTLIGFFMLPGAFLAIAAGYSGRFFSDRVLAGFGLFALGLGGALGAIADGFGTLGAGRIVCGVGFVVSTIYFTKMAADWFGGKELATAMGILVMSWPFGIAMGQIGHEWLAVTYEWRAAFWVAAVYCLVGAGLLVAFYRAPAIAKDTLERAQTRLSGRELGLTLTASLVWAFFNAGYVVYLSFAPQVLVSQGFGKLQAALVISLASWVMIFSGAICGQIADRTRKPNLVLYLCMAVAVASLLLLPQSSLAIPVALAFGLMGMAPAGVIMALTGESMAPGRRAFGMGVFFTSYFVVLAPTPAIAGWLYDQSGDPFLPILFAALLFTLTAVANVIFRIAQRVSLASYR